MCRAGCGLQTVTAWPASQAAAASTVPMAPAPMTTTCMGPPYRGLPWPKSTSPGAMNGAGAGRFGGRRSARPNHQGVALAAATAQRRDPDSAPSPAQLVQQREGQPVA